MFSCSRRRPYALIDSIQGRTEDIPHFPTQADDWVTVHPNVFHDVLDLLPVSGWQIIQQVDGLKVLLSGVREGFQDELIITPLHRTLTAQGMIAPCVKIEHVVAISRRAVGKAALIRSELLQGVMTAPKKNQ